MRAASLLFIPAIAASVAAGGPHNGSMAVNSMKPHLVVSVPIVATPTIPDLPPSAPLNSVFRATTSSGRIGVFEDLAEDEAADNLFHVQLDRSPASDEAVWLEYDLLGLTSHDAVPRSINHGLAIGGGGEVLNEWSHQRERISATSVHPGRNSIWFLAPTEPATGYEVRDVRLVFGPAPVAQSIVVTNAHCLNSSGSVYVKGFLDEALSNVIRMEVSGQSLRLYQGVFEGTVHLAERSTVLEISAWKQDGTKITVGHVIEVGYKTATDEIIPEAPVVHENVIATVGYTLRIEDAELSIPPLALAADKRITAIALSVREVPPTGQDLINVTTNGAGYRFLPDGTTFTSAVGLMLPFDSLRIPPGYGPEDIRTFYFDEDQRRWMALPKDSVQAKDSRIHSRTTHFTDYINGIIQVPESPETMGYAPTSIKDYKAGDVSAGITPMSPPSASNTGAVTTRFPLKLPQGRQGMQPELAIQYNSEGGNGWMGLGWNLSTPSISIDTRWGVPRYDAAKETETYLLDGEMLNPVAHRTTWVDRSTNKIFHTRVEGAFRKIERMGQAPGDCYWKVTDKDGTVRYYGGDESGVVNSTVLRTGNNSSAIAKWMLRRVVDRNGNVITYTYQTVSDPGTDNSTNIGRQIYPQRIRYTGRDDGADGPYEVEFILDDASRVDKQINCRLGFKEVTASLLDRVEVKYNGDTIRSYHFSYSEGAFKKTLLDSIVEYDANGVRFYGHAMEYYDDVREAGEYVPYRDGNEWNTPLEDDGLAYSALNPNVTVEDEQVSFLGGSLTTNYSFGGSANIGPIGNPFLQSNTIGGSFGYSRSSGEGLSTLVDINGDNLPDKLFRKNHQLRYRPNLAAEGSFGFGDDLPLSGLAGENFSETKTRSTNIGIEAHAGPIFVGKSWGDSRTTTQTYLMDRNGDGLMDISRNGSVYFNFRNTQGAQEFTLESDSTENPIVPGEAILLQPNDSIEEQSILSESPLIDVVKVWVAPYSGSVNVLSTIELLPEASDAFNLYTHKDGVTASIESGEQVLCTLILDTTMFGSELTFNCTALQGLEVVKGQRVFFRLGSIVDGAYDRVNWDQRITYASVYSPDLIPSSPSGLRLDANGKDVYAFSASEDFSLFNSQGVAFNSHGKVLVKGTLHKPVTSDSIRTEIVLRDSLGVIVNTIRSTAFSWAVGVDSILIDTVEVDTNEFLDFRILASTNVEWDSISWHPEVSYIEHDGLTTAQLVDTAGNPLLKFKPVVGCSMFNEPRAASFVGDTRFNRPYIPNVAGELRLMPHVQIPNNFPALSGTTAAGTVTYSVKRRHELVSKQSRYFQIGTQFSPDWDEDTIQVSPFDTLYIEVDIDNRQLSDSLIISLTVSSPDIPNVQVAESLLAVYTLPYDSVDLVFGPLYRRWGQFGYNYAQIDGATFSTPIEEDSLHIRFGTIDPSLFDQLDNNMESDVDDLESATGGNWGNPLATTFTTFFVNTDSAAWFGIDDRTFVARSIMSSSRLGEDDVSFSDGYDILQDAITAPIKVNKDGNESKSWGVSIVCGLGYSSSKGSGNSNVIIDAQDLDGDRFPDIVSEDRIQGTTPLGGYELTPRTHLDGGHHAVSLSEGWSVGGGFVKPNFSNSASPSSGLVESAAFFSSNPIKNLFKAQHAEETAKTSIGVNVNMSVDPTVGKDSALVSWNDVNGDGLADKVYNNGMVRLNLGRSFLGPEYWDFDAIRSGQSRDYGYGGGGSLNVENMSFAAGVSASRTENGTMVGLMDVNGDGLIDVVQSEGSGSTPWRIVSVRVNTGSGFSDPIDWDIGDNGLFDAGRTIGEAANASYTYGFTIPLPPLKFAFNVNGSWGHGFSRTETQFADIDGDAFPDFLYSTDDNELVVRSSTIRRTNLIKEVHSPFGAKWKVDYEVAGNTYDLPQSKWVMKDLLVWDGFIGDGADSLHTTFSYAAGQYDRRERETYGFDSVRTDEWNTEANTSTPYRSSIQTYDVSGYYTKGLPLVKTVQDGAGNKFAETVNTYTLKLLNGNDAPASYNSDNDNGSAFPALTRTDQLFYEGEAAAGITHSTLFEYDSLGNVSKYSDLGFEGQDDAVEADIEYHDLASQYIKSTPSKVTVSVDGGVRRYREQDIDSNGNVTEIRQTIDNDAEAAYKLDYYDNGNLKKLTRPANYKGETMFYQFVYDPAVQTYVTDVSDAYHYHSSSAYEYRFGQLLGTTDMNGQATEYVIDDRGRVSSVRGPYEIASGKPYTIKLDYVDTAVVPYSVATHFDPEHPDGAGIRTVTFLDGLFRPIQIKKSAVFSDGNGGEQERFIVSGRVHFDAFGRTIRQFYPIVDIGALFTFASVTDAVAPTTTGYDVLDRKVVETLPDGSVNTMAYSIATANGGPTAFKTQVTDALTNKKDSYTDVREREIARTDFDPNEIWTTLRYNAIGELQDVTDNRGNITSYTYDQLGRKLTYDHPDGGLTEFTYDPAGNLLTKNTANLRDMFPDGGPIKYSYDHERVDTINYPRNYQNQVVYTYGDSTETQFNRVGRVKLQLDGSGGQEFFYGPLGEVEKSIRTIVVSQTDIRTFVSEDRYDTWNRIQVMKYPDGDSVSYSYNTAGKLKQVTSVKDNFTYDVVKDIGYDKFEQRVYMKHGNNVETRYAYEPERRRLSTLRVDQPNGTRIMDNVYTYDQVNNVLSLVNDRAVPGDGQGGQMSSSYQYDPLYRLTNATGHYTGSAREDQYELTMAYNDLHNITHKTQTHSSSFPTATLSNYDFEYTYDTVAPHTPSKVGYRAYGYDANGNLSDWEEDAPRMGTRHMAWDEENRLQAVNDAGYVSQFTYDAGGERVLKSHGGMEGVFINGAPVGLINHRDNYTIYVSPYLVQAEHGFTKHYFIEGQRVASRTGNGHFITGPLLPNGITAGRVDFKSRILAMQQAANQQVVNNAPVPGIPTLGGYNGQPEISGTPTYLNNIGTYAAPDPAEGWPMPPVPPGAPGTPPTTPLPSVTNETVTAGYGFVTDANQAENNRYFFHPDHLGSASYITGADGTARQHLEYMAFGETFVEEQNAADPLDYLFNGKEQDRITGLYYYGARYYDPVASMWASVDPMAEKYAGHNVFAYVSWRPLQNTDPLGMSEEVAVEDCNPPTARKLFGDMVGTASSGLKGMDAAFKLKGATKMIANDIGVLDDAMGLMSLGCEISNNGLEDALVGYGGEQVGGKLGSIVGIKGGIEVGLAVGCMAGPVGCVVGGVVGAVGGAIIGKEIGERVGKPAALGAVRYGKEMYQSTINKAVNGMIESGYSLHPNYDLINTPF